MYADTTYYYEEYKGKIEDPDQLERYLEDASNDIDTLTYYRINRIGWDKLTDFQKEQIKRVCCKQADFKISNADVLESPLDSYSINGVSMGFGNSSYYGIHNGVPMENTTYRMLLATGLATNMIYPNEVMI